MADLKAHVFISYSRVDLAFAKPLADLLSQAYEVLFDQQLVGGDKWWAEILRKIAQCDHFVYLISRESVESEWCKKELVEAQRLKKHIIPVLIRARTEVPEKLQSLQLIDMSMSITAENLNKLYAALIKATNNRLNPEINIKRFSVDTRLLERLWPLISIQNIRRLDYETQMHYIDATFYQDSIIAYLHLRDLRDNPQNAFFNADLEENFKAFDEALSAYDVQMLTNAFSFEIKDGRDVYMSDYKACSISRYRMPSVTQEIINYKLAEYNKTVELVLDVRERHNELVNAIKSAIPDFDFSDDSG